MERLSLILLFAAFTASAQLAPRVEVITSIPTSGKDAVPEKAVTDEAAKQAAQIDTDKPVSDAKLDVAPTVRAQFEGAKEIHSVTFYSGKESMDTAKQFIAKSAFPKGTVVTLSTHLCPGTNTPPKGWLGCALDPRAENSVTVLKP